jgi:hypothetical protein
MSKKETEGGARSPQKNFLFWLKTAVAAKKVESSGRVLYDVHSVLSSEPAKRHLAALHGRSLDELNAAASGKR